MGQMVIEEEKRLREKSDDALMQLYVNQSISSFPSTVIVKALSTVMEERDIIPTGTDLSFKFKKAGELCVINLIKD